MIIWDKTAELLVIQSDHGQTTLSSLTDDRLKSILLSIKGGPSLKDSKAMMFGITLIKHLLSKLITIFGPKIKHYTTICPIWSSQKKHSRFTKREHIIFERPLLRTQLKIKPMRTENRVKIFITLQERVKNPPEIPIDYGLLSVMTFKTKILLVEKFKTGETILKAPVEQYRLAKKIKNQLDPISSLYPLQIRVNVEQREKKERLVIISKVTEIPVENIIRFFDDLLSHLGEYLIC